MPVVTICPECSAKMKVSDNAVGKQIKCPKCNNPFTVTAGGAPPPRPQGVAPAPVAPMPVAPDPLEQLSGMESAGDDLPPPRRPGGYSRGSGSGNPFADFLTFRLFITPMVIQVLFWLGVLGCLIWGMIALYGAVRMLEFSFAAALIPLTGAMLILFIGPIMVRVQCELTMVFFRMYDTLREIRDINESK
jgi:predicted Zn finger-like uncharacterized protein